MIGTILLVILILMLVVYCQPGHTARRGVMDPAADSG